MGVHGGMRALALAAVALLTACGSDSESTTNEGAGGTPVVTPDASAGGVQAPDAANGGAGGAGGAGGQATGGAMIAADAAVPAPDAGPIGPPACPDSDLPVQPFIFPQGPDAPDGPPADQFGPFRHQLARDFGATLLDGAEFRLSRHWNGCESYVFLTDTIPLSDANGGAAWSQDIADLIGRSPRNVNYIFVSRSLSENAARESVGRVQAQVDTVLQGMSEEDAAHWRTHLLLVAEPAANISGWVKSALRGHGTRGMAIDRFQRVRGVGSMADVVRYDRVAADAGGWPWTNNIAYAAYEARHFNFEANRAARMAAETITEVSLFAGETVAGFQDVEVDLPDADTMAGFDTFEVEVEQRCPNGEPAEVGNCGAWDYLAYLWLSEGPEGMEQRTELARFITSYHRETHWVVDVTPMLALLKDGGHRKFRWEFAPEWNTQPTATWLKLRFSNRGKGYRPDTVVSVATGGAFNAMYNAGRMPVMAEIPADARRVELYAVTTGHGAETNQCAEFCDHQHAYTVNGREHLQGFPEAQVPDGCVDMVDRGMTPNQYGTWWFGRGGWCPGMQVDPFVVDVSDEAPAGSTATVTYEGRFGGRAPPPDGSGNIALNAWLVIYR
jgi:hypothetical protein